MSTRRFLFGILFLVVLCINTTICNAKKNQNCHITSSCGHIHNISFPFRLKTDPHNCGDPSYELACKNNQTILYFGSMDYYVLSINYENYTIRIVDPAFKENQCPSFPLHSLTSYDIPSAYMGNYEGVWLSELNYHVTFISCPSQVESSLYVDTASCSRKNTSFVVVGDDLERAGVKESCMVNMVAWFSLEFSITDNTSFLSIIDTMTNGFSLFWYHGSVYCRECDLIRGYCYLQSHNNLTCLDIRSRTPNFSDIGVVRIYNGLWSIWKELPDIWWGELSRGQFYHRFNPHNSRLRDLPVIFFGDLSKPAALILLPRFLCGFPCLLILVVYKFRRRHLSNDENIEEFLQAQINLMPIRYSYADIRKMTTKFKHKLGEGGYGYVFKGKLRSGLFVAVKMMNKSKASGQEFINEVATIGTIHHINVVQLIGFCVEGSKRALVYEFMPNGSLEKYTFSQEERTSSLSYEKMFEISLGVARGIDYLHRGCEMQILHFDIKPHNILLDENFNPKVSDFGLAKLYSTDDSIVSLTAARGTMGYMAPELFYKNIGGVSYKADVYSYGMLLMEMAGRRKNLNPFLENLSQIYFPSWVYDQFSEGKEIVSEDTSGEERKMVKKMILVGLWCIQMKPVDRPSMNKIIEMLEGDDQNLEMPPKPFLYPEQSRDEDHGR